MSTNTHANAEARYIRVQQNRLDEWTTAQNRNMERRAFDTRVALIAYGLQQACDAAPDSLRGLDVQMWAQRIVNETVWE